jgi:cbb3-type cytochrome oxidase maturation protein
VSALYLLIGFSMLVALIFLAAFFWAVRRDQFRDTCTPALRVLFDEAATPGRSRDSSTEVSG